MELTLINFFTARHILKKRQVLLFGYHLNFKKFIQPRLNPSFESNLVVPGNQVKLTI